MAVHLQTGEFFGTTTARGEARGVLLSCLQHPAARKLPEHAHEAAFFTMLLRGHYRERAGGREIDYDPLTVVFHPPSYAHRDEIGAAGSVMISVEVGRELFDAYDLALPPLARQSMAASRALLALYRAARNGLLAPLAVESAVIELLADAAKTPEVHERATPPWLGRVMALLEELPASPRVADLAAEANVHPVHFTRVFRRHLGVTPGEYLQRRRLRAALRMIGTSPLSDVALASGFADQSHLSRAVRAALGETPGRLAKLLR